VSSLPFRVPSLQHPPHDFRSRALPAGVSSLLAAPSKPSTHCGGSHASTTFRPQVFSTSRRFPPALTSQAFYGPQPRPGFQPFRGFSLRAAAPPSSGSAFPHAVGRFSLTARRRLPLPRPRLRGVTPHEDTFRRVSDQPSLWPFPSSGSSSPRLCSLPPWAPVPRSLPPMRFPGSVFTLAFPVPLRRLPGESSGQTISSLTDLLEVLSLPTILR
jgi:hypothetical protein